MLLPNPTHPHWSHCPQCEPSFTTWITYQKYIEDTRPKLLSVGVPSSRLKGKRMSVLKAKQRNALPSSSFGLPGKRMFPLTDKVHDEKALEFVNRSIAAGHITAAQGQLVKAEARRRLDGIKKVGRAEPRKGLVSGRR